LTVKDSIWDTAYAKWLVGKTPTDSHEFKTGVYAGTIDIGKMNYGI